MQRVSNLLFGLPHLVLLLLLLKLLYLPHIFNKFLCFSLKILLGLLELLLENAGEVAWKRLLVLKVGLFMELSLLCGSDELALVTTKRLFKVAPHRLTHVCFWVQKDGRVCLLHNLLQSVLKGHKSRAELVLETCVGWTSFECDLAAMELERIVQVLDGLPLVVFHFLEHHLVGRGFVFLKNW